MPKEVPAEKKRKSIYDAELRPGHKPVGYFNALVHLLKGNIGVGLFAMGDACKNGGIFVAPPLIVLIGLICVHCMHILLTMAKRMTAEHKQDDDEPIDYAITAELCFENAPEKVARCSEKIPNVINSFICITQLGFCCVYLVFIASNLQQVLDINGINIELRLLIVAVWIPIWLSCLITNLTGLAPVSMVANILIIGSFIATLVFAFKDGLPNISERRPYTSLDKLALFFGTVIFTFEGIGLVLPIKNAMKNPDKFASPCGVLNVGMSIVISMFTLAAIVGYWKWGEDVEGSLTLNIGNSITAQCVKLGVSLGIMFSYPLQFFVPVQILLPSFLQKTRLNNRPLFGELLFRTLLTICTLIVAQIVPNVGLFISLIGAVCSSALALIFPPILELLLIHQASSVGYKAAIITKDILIIILGLLGFFVGTTISLIDVVKFFQGEDSPRKSH